MPRPERHYAHTGKGISVYTPWGIKREHIEAGSEQAQALEQNRLRRLVLHPKPCALVIAHLSSRICHCEEHPERSALHLGTESKDATKQSLNTVLDATSHP